MYEGCSKEQCFKNKTFLKEINTSKRLKIGDKIIMRNVKNEIRNLEYMEKTDCSMVVFPQVSGSYS